MFIIDINGPKKPNIWGRDFFGINYYYDGSLDVVTPECKKGIANINSGTICNGYNSASENRETKFASNGLDLHYGMAFGKILNDGWKMDY